MAWLCTSGAIIRKAGKYADSTAVASAALIKDYYEKAAGVVCMKCRKDWVGTAPDAVIADAVSDAVSDMAATKLIVYSQSSYTQLAEAQTILNVLKDNFDQTIKDLRNKEYQEFS